MNLFGFGDEAIATLIVGFLTGTALPIIFFFISRRRPSQILCKQIIRSSLVDVKEEAKQKIFINFSTVVFWLISSHRSCRQHHTLFGKQLGEHRFRLLSLGEAVVDIE